jgi:hypothetical protein
VLQGSGGRPPEKAGVLARVATSLVHDTKLRITFTARASISSILIVWDLI